MSTASGANWPTWEPDEILPGLWQGGTEDSAVIGGRVPSNHYRADFPFHTVITLYADAHPAPWGVEELRFGFPDADLRPSFIEHVMALAVHAHARWTAGHEVLIRCQAGVNRSGLVTALVLMLAGRTADEAIALIRERRSEFALCNRDSERWLRDEATFYLPLSSAA